ncbi:MAG TPA: hypothetical protein VHF26_22980, partial [Trebonia sp.]|nr:hypothetical protein [Trebonia sp.]
LSRTGHPGRGLHLGWIPNDPGRRPRDFGETAPADPSPDQAKVRAAKDARDRTIYFARLLIGIGVIVALLFGGLGFIHRLNLFWGIAAVLALACWIPAGCLMWSRRRAVAALDRDTARRRELHAAELVAYNERKAAWDKTEAERTAKAPKWLRVTSHEDISRLDVFGGTAAGRENLLTGLGLALLEEHAVIVLDLSQERVCDGLLATAGQSGYSCQDYQLPRDLRATPLLSGLSGDEIASQIVEVLHADDPRATAAGRATDLLILNKIHRALGTGIGGAGLSMARLHEALGFLLGEEPAAGAAADGVAGDGAPAAGASAEGASAAGASAEGATGGGSQLSERERAALDGAFGETFRREAASGLVRLAAVTEPLRDLGLDGAARTPAQLTCLSLADGPRGVTADLIAALIVQWATHSIVADVSAGGTPGGTRSASAGSGGTVPGGAGSGGAGAGDSASGAGSGPAVILAGGDEQDQRHLARLTGVCERYGVPLIRTFSRLTE